jgi:hypothetical protein
MMKNMLNEKTREEMTKEMREETTKIGERVDLCIKGQ